MRILLVVAMQEEADIIINKFQLTFTKTLDNLFKHYHGNYQDKTIMLTTTGYEPQFKVSSVGTVPAAVATYAAVKNFMPDLVINLGTAGGLKTQDVHINDVYISTKIYYYDHRIPIPGYQAYGMGEFTSAPLPKIDSIREGVICSGDSFDENASDYALMQKLRCSSVDMEAAGIAWVCEKLSIPMAALKVITNFVEGEAIQSTFLTNFHNSMEILIKNLEILLGRL